MVKLSTASFVFQDPQLQQLLSLRECVQNPSVGLVRGILEPLRTLKNSGKITSDSCLILIDSLNEAEFHKPDYGDTVASFVVRHASKFPAWLKLVVVCQSVIQDIIRPLPYHHIVLDKKENGENLSRDMQEYVHQRLTCSNTLRNNIAPHGKLDASTQQKFTAHVQSLSKGCFLYTKLVLDLIEHGHLVLKSSNYKILPVNVSEVFLLHFNIKFSSVRAFERISNILGVCLAALYPLDLETIFMTVNSGFTHRFIQWDDFCNRMAVLSGERCKRFDINYQLASQGIAFFSILLKCWSHLAFITALLIKMFKSVVIGILLHLTVWYNRASVSIWIGDHISMSISGDSPSDEILN